MTFEPKSFENRINLRFAAFIWPIQSYYDFIKAENILFITFDPYCRYPYTTISPKICHHVIQYGWRTFPSLCFGCSVTSLATINFYIFSLPLERNGGFQTLSRESVKFSNFGNAKIFSRRHITWAAIFERSVRKSFDGESTSKRFSPKFPPALCVGGWKIQDFRNSKISHFLGINFESRHWREALDIK